MQPRAPMSPSNHNLNPGARMAQTATSPSHRNGSELSGATSEPTPATPPQTQMHVCRLCDKLLSSSSSLDRHMLTHSGERPFVCKRCHMTFTTNGNMHRHMRTHLHKDSLARQQQEQQQQQQQLQLKQQLQHSTNILAGQSINNAPATCTPAPIALASPISSSDIAGSHKASANTNTSTTLSQQLAAHLHLQQQLQQQEQQQQHLEQQQQQQQPDNQIHIQIPSSTPTVAANFAATVAALAASQQRQQAPINSATLLNQLAALQAHRRDQDHQMRASISPTTVTGSHSVHHHQITCPLANQQPEVVNETNNQSLESVRAVMLVAAAAAAHAQVVAAQAAAQINQPQPPQTLLLQTATSGGPQQQQLRNKRRKQVKPSRVQLSASPASSPASSSTSGSSSSGSSSSSPASTSSIASASASASAPTPTLTPTPATPTSTLRDDAIETDATTPMTTTTTTTTTMTTSMNEADIIEDISQSYVKTANPNATRKGGKRNRHCYKCKLCTYSSVDRCTLVRHLRIHSGERPYICGICRYAFTTKANCERHVRKRHKKQYNSLGGSGGVKGSNGGGRSLIITDHSNHQTIPVKVNPVAAQTISQTLQRIQEKQQHEDDPQVDLINQIDATAKPTKTTTTTTTTRKNTDTDDINIERIHYHRQNISDDPTHTALDLNNNNNNNNNNQMMDNNAKPLLDPGIMESIQQQQQQQHLQHQQSTAQRRMAEQLSSLLSTKYLSQQFAQLRNLNNLQQNANATGNVNVNNNNTANASAASVAPFFACRNPFEPFTSLELAAAQQALDLSCKFQTQK